MALERLGETRPLQGEVPGRSLCCRVHVPAKGFPAQEPSTELDHVVGGGGWSLLALNQIRITRQERPLSADQITAPPCPLATLRQR